DRPPSYTEAHHITPWADGGKTDLADGILMCRDCHMLIHNNGWTIIRDGTEYYAVPPPDIDPDQKPIPLPKKSPLARARRRAAAAKDAAAVAESEAEAEAEAGAVGGPEHAAEDAAAGDIPDKGNAADSAAAQTSEARTVAAGAVAAGAVAAENEPEAARAQTSDMRSTEGIAATRAHGQGP
ncbi:MAG: HNH endonuclease signature motif containing protein, partial [Mycetocola sp.]